MKYVYKNNNGLAVTGEKISILELAIFDEFKNKVKDVQDKIIKREGYIKNLTGDKKYKSKTTIFDELGLNQKDWIATSDGVFYYDTDVNEYQTIERIQNFEAVHTFTEEEQQEFHEILLNWITENDHVFDLYQYIRELDYSDKYTKKFEYLYSEYLERENMLENVKYHYQLAKGDN